MCCRPYCSSCRDVRTILAHDSERMVFRNVPGLSSLVGERVSAETGLCRVAAPHQTAKGVQKMACQHNNEVDKCDDCIALAERRDKDAQGIQRAAESRRIRGAGRREEDGSDDG